MDAYCRAPSSLTRVGYEVLMSPTVNVRAASPQDGGKGNSKSEGSQAFFLCKRLPVPYNHPESPCYIRFFSLEPRSSFCPILLYGFIPHACRVPLGYVLRTDDSDPHLGSPWCRSCAWLPVLSTCVSYPMKCVCILSTPSTI